MNLSHLLFAFGFLVNHFPCYSSVEENLGKFQSFQWIRSRKPEQHELFLLVIGIEPHDHQALEDYFWRITEPGNEDYGNHLTKSGADKLTAPHPQAVPEVTSWIRTFLDTDNVYFDPSVNLIKVIAHVGQVEGLLRTKLHEFVHVRSRRRILRAVADMHVPPTLKPYISYLNANLAPAQVKIKSPRRLDAGHVEGKSDNATPDFLRKLYKIPADLVVTNPRCTQGIAEFFYETWSESDVKLFNKKMGVTIESKLIQKGDRPNDVETSTTEAALDLQYIAALAPNATTEIWTMNGTNPYSSIDEPFLEWGQQVLKEENPPLVFSMSYSDDEEHVFKASESYARSFDNVLKKMGVRGITVLFSSGDDGVAGQRPDVAKLPVKERCTKHGPQWPTSSPYVTVVGATMLLRNDDGDEFYRYYGEVACSGSKGGMITTGGGFSNEYGTARYQKDHTSAYIEKSTGHLPEGFFNRSGRGYPDLSAYGANYAVYVNGQEHAVAGTSASTPVIAAMITLWNDRRMNAGKPPLGFINPLLYEIARQNSSAFNDVFIGSNGASQAGIYVCPHSFHAAPGWDATTGLGTPNFPVLSELTFYAEDLTKKATEITPPQTKPKEEKPKETKPPAPKIPSSSNLPASTEMSTYSMGAFSVVLLGFGWIILAIIGIGILWKRYDISRGSNVLVSNKEATVRHANEDETGLMISTATIGNEEEVDDDDDEEIEIALTTDADTVVV